MKITVNSTEVEIYGMTRYVAVATDGVDSATSPACDDEDVAISTARSLAQSGYWDDFNKVDYGIVDVQRDSTDYAQQAMSEGQDSRSGKHIQDEESRSVTMTKGCVLGLVFIFIILWLIISVSAMIN